MMMKANDKCHVQVHYEEHTERELWKSLCLNSRKKRITISLTYMDAATMTTKKNLLKIINNNKKNQLFYGICTY